MNTKLLSLLSLSIFSLVLVMGLASAVDPVFTLTEVSTPDSIMNNAGNFDVIFEISYTGTVEEGIIVDLSASDLTTGVGTIGFYSEDVPIEDLTNISLAQNETKEIKATITFDDGQTGTIVGTIDAIPSSGTQTNFTFSVELTDSTPTPVKEPEEITECKLTGDNGDLKVSIENYDVIEGFGKDEEWFPFDTIEIEVEVENRNSQDDIDNIELSWGLYDKDADRWYIDDSENDFDLKDDDKETITFTFQLDDDIEDLDGGDFVLYVWANGDLQDDDDTSVCASDSQNIDIIIENDFVILDDIQITGTASCGSNLQVTADVWNIGDDRQKDVMILISEGLLGISEKIDIGEIDEFDSENLDKIIKIPSDAKPGIYYIEFRVYDDDKIYENDFDDDESLFKYQITVEGSCSGEVSEDSVLVIANLESGGQAGKQMVIKATITNLGDNIETYSLNAAGYAEWAATYNVAPTTLVLEGGASEDVMFTFDVLKGVSGDQLFNIEVMSGNKVVLQQPVSVTVTSGGANLSGLFGDSWYLWLIGALNIILVVIIIVVAVKVAKK